MSTFVDALAKHGAMLAAGTTLVLLAGTAAMLLLRGPARQQRLGEAVLAASLLFVAVACMPLPRWDVLGWVAMAPAVPGLAAAKATDATVSEPVERTHVRSQIVEVGPLATDAQAETPPFASEPRTSQIIAQEPLPATRSSDTAAEAASRHAVAPSATETARSSERATGVAPVAPVAATAAAPTRHDDTSWHTWIAVGYLSCAGLCLAWLAVGWFVLRHTLRRARRADGWLAVLYEALPWESGQPRPPLFVSDAMPRPVCYGLHRAVIVVPSADCRPEAGERLRHVLLHELAHAQRHDGASRLLGCTCLPVLYFHPLYWWLRQRIEYATEVLADQRAAQHSSPETYASQLVLWASERQADRRLSWGGTSVWRSPSEFYRRMALLLTNHKPAALDCTAAWKIACRAACGCAALLLAIAIGVPPQTLADAKDDIAPNSKVNAPVNAAVAETADEIGLYDDRPAEARYREAVEVVRRHAEKLKQAGEMDRAERVVATLAQVQREFDAPAEVKGDAKAQPQVDVLGIVGEGPQMEGFDPVRVEVTNTARPTILAFIRWQPTRWEISIKPGARVVGVLACNRNATHHQYRGLPEGTPIHEVAYASGDGLDPFDDRFRTLARRDGEARIVATVGLKVSTAAARERNDGEPFVVGPENADWRAQRAATALAQLRAEADQAEREENRKRLGDLRFDTLHKVYRGGHYHDPKYAVSFGSMTLDGPMWRTYLPVSSKLRCLSRDARGALYGIDDGTAATVDVAAAEQTPLLNDGEPAHIPDTKTMVVHQTKNRLLAWGKGLYVYDIASQSWSVREKPKHAPTAAVYVPSKNAILGLEAEAPRPGGTRVIVRLSRYDENGERVATTTLPQPILVDPNSEGGFELALAGDYLVVLRRSFARYAESTASRTLPARMFVLDPADGRILWMARNTVSIEGERDAAVKDAKAAKLETLDDKGPEALAERQIAGQVVGFVGNAMADPSSPSERLKRRFEDIERVIADTERSNPTESEALAAELKGLKELAAGNYADFAKDAKAPELHVVSVSEGRAVPLKKFKQVDVVVSHTQRPVILVLLGYYTTQWNVKVADGATIEQVIVSSYDKGSKVVGFESMTNPPQIDVFEGDSGSNSLRYFYPTRRQLDSDLPTANKLRELTGLDVATLLGEYNYRGTPYEVGPKNEAWRTQHVLHLSTTTHNRAVRPEREKLWAELSNLRIMAVHRAESGGRERVFPGRGDGGPGDRALAEYTPIGPIADSLVTLDQSLRNVAVDPWEGTVYGVGKPGVFTIDRKSGRCLPIPLADADEKIDNPIAVAFDGKRKRLLVWAKELHTYDTLKKQWSHRRHSGQSLYAAVYSPQEDIIYAIDGATEENSVREAQAISRINANGALIDRISLSHRIWIGHYEGRAQLALAGDKLILLIPSVVRGEGGGEATKTWCYTIDRKTGEVLWASPATAVRSTMD